MQSLFSSMSIPTQFEEYKYHNSIKNDDITHSHNYKTYSLETIDLLRLILTNSETLDDIKSIINCILESDDKQLSIDDLNEIYQEWNKSKELSKARLLTDFNHPINTIPGDDSSILLEIINTLFFTSQNLDIIPETAKICNDKLESLENTIKLIPPSKETKLDHKYFSGMLTVDSVCSRGMASDGNYLFILSPNANLTVFPLLDNGALLTPFTVALDITPSVVSSIMIINQFLYVRSESMVNYLIPEILSRRSTPIHGMEVFDDDKLFMLASDGVVYVTIHNNKYVTVYDVQTDKKITDCILYQSNAPIHPDRPELIDDQLIYESMVETNGTFLSFYIKINNRNYLCRQFSLINGLHVRDFLLDDDFNISCINLNIIHKLHYCVRKVGGQLVVEANRYIGADDPFIYGLEVPRMTNMFALEDHVMMKTSTILFENIGVDLPQIMRLKNADEFQILLSNIMFYMNKDPNDPKIRVTLQTFVLIAAMHCQMFNNNKKSISLLEAILINIPKKFSDNISINLIILLLTQCWDFVMSKNIINAVVELASLTKGPIYERLIADISRSHFLARVSLSQPNVLSHHLLNDCVYEKSNKIIMQLLMLQQRVLIRETAKELENDTFSSVKLFKMSNVSTTMLDFLGEYSSIIVNAYINSLGKYHNEKERFNSSTHYLFYNFMKLLIGISQYHAVSQMILPLLTMVVISLNNFNEKIKNYDSNMAISFYYGIFCSTLLKGGDVSDFEKKNKWIITANTNLMDNEAQLNSSIKNERKGEEFDLCKSLMSSIYTIWKPAIHKKLKDNAKEIDYLSLLIFSKHDENTINNIKQSIEEKKINEQARQVLENIAKVRNHFMQIKNDSDSNNLLQEKINILLNLKSNFEEEDDKLKIITNFLISKDSANSIIHFISNQKIRFQLTSIGFALLQDIFSKNLSQIFYTVVVKVFSNVKNFDNLCQILKFSSKPLASISNFIRISVAKKDQIPILPIIRKLIESNAMNEKDIGEILTGSFLQLLNDENTNIEQIALCWGYFHTIQNSVNVLMDKISKEQKLYHVAILRNCLETAKTCSVEVYCILLEHVMNCNPKIAKQMVLAFYNALKHADLPKEKLVNDFGRILEFIGDNILMSTKLATVSELIGIFRLLLKEENMQSNVLREVLSNIDECSNLNMKISVLGILGGNIEIIHPYCHATIRTDFNTQEECVMIEPTNYIQIPINEETKKKNVQKADIFAKNSVDFDPKDFPDFAKVISLAISCFDQNELCTAIVINCLSIFCENSEFCKQFKTTIVHMIGNLTMPYDAIDESIEKYINASQVKTTNEYYGFDVLMKDNHPTYLSKPLKNNALVIVNIQCKKNFEGTVGIIDMHNKKCNTNNLVYLPQCISLPLKKDQNGTINSPNITLFVDFNEKVFKINDVVFPWKSNPSLTHKILIHTTQQITITMETDQNYFADRFIVPKIVPGITDFSGNAASLISLPTWIPTNNLQPLDLIVKDTIKDFTNPCQAIHTVIGMDPPPHGIIEPADATSMTKNLKDCLIEQIMFEIRTQISTIVLTKLISNDSPEMIPEEILVRLFSILMCMLEPVYYNGSFPWDTELNTFKLYPRTNKLIYNMTEISINCLKTIMKVPSFKDYLIQYTSKLVSNPNTHVLTNFAQNCKILIPGTFNPAGITPDFKNNPRISNVIIGFSIFNYMNDALIYIELLSHQTPYYAHPEIDFGVSPKPPVPLFILPVYANSNTWMFGTTYECLLLLNVIHSLNLSTDPCYTKIKLIDMVVASCPLAVYHSTDFLNLLSTKVVANNSCSVEYSRKLAYVASYGKRYPNLGNEFLYFAQSEASRLLSDLSDELGPYFPEFKLTPPKNVNMNANIRIKLPSLEFASSNMKNILLSRIMNISSILARSNTIEGFQFYIALGYWLALNYELPNIEDQKPPVISLINDNVLMIKNSCTVKVSLKDTLPPETLIISSPEPTFYDNEFCTSSDLPKTFNVDNVLYICAVPAPGKPPISANIFLVNQVLQKSTNQETIPNVCYFIPSKIHDEFVSDMIIFRTKWTPNDTIKLMQEIPNDILIKRDYREIINLALHSSLIKDYPTKVVLMQSLFIHEFNYIISQINFSPNESLSHYISPIIQSKSIISSFTICDRLTAQIEINRRMARNTIMTLPVNSTNQAKTIIAQLSNEISESAAKLITDKYKPWRVKFTDEAAIDAGGPSRELFHEVSESIFQPHSMLFIPTPNGRNQIGNNRDLYVPFTTLGRYTSKKQYFVVGVYLAMVMRTGYFQDLPFANIVWKYLANESPDEEDVTSIDKQLGDLFKTLRSIREEEFNERFPEMKWALPNWDGTPIILKSKVLVKFQDIHNFISMCLNARFAALDDALQEMRRGFLANAGIRNTSSIKMTGRILSYLAQGSTLISVESLKAIIRTNMKYPEIFWEAVAMMTNEQRSLLLKFATTLTRIPNSSIHEHFIIAVNEELSKPEYALPTASTCFNRMYIPRYPNATVTYQKLVTAIEMCDTMENA